MPIEVETPDGIAEFPDEMQPDEIQAVLQKHYTPSTRQLPTPDELQQGLGAVGRAINLGDTATRMTNVGIETMRPQTIEMSSIPKDRPYFPTPEELGVMAERDVQPSLLEHAGAALLNIPAAMYRSATGVVPKVAVTRTDSSGQETIGEEPAPLPFQPGKPVYQFPRTELQPEGNDATRLLEGVITPGMISTFPFGATKPVQAFFLTQTAPAAIESLARFFSPNLSQEERRSAATDFLVNAVMTHGIAKHLGGGIETTTTGEPNAGTKPSPESVLKHEDGTPVGEGPSLRQQGKTSGAQENVQPLPAEKPGGGETEIVAAAKEIGADVGAVGSPAVKTPPNLESLPAEEQAMYRQMAEQSPQTVELTDRRAGSPTRGLTINPKVGSTKAEVLDMWNKAKEGYVPIEVDAINRLQPAILVDGNPITGKTHIEAALEAGTPEAIEAASKPENQGFIFDGKFVSREQAAEMVGEKQPLTSERLTELREGKKPSPEKPAEEIGPVSDWTSATEESPEAAFSPELPKAEKPAEQLMELGAGVPFPKFSNRKMSVLDRITAAWSGKYQKSFGEARRAQKEIKAEVPREARQNAISIYREAGGDMAVLKDWEARAKQKWMRDAARDAQTVTPEEAAIAKQAGSAYDVLEKRGNTYDVLKSHRDNYVTHVWDVDKPGSGFGSKTLKQRFRFAKARTFNTFFEGDQAGFKPKTLAIGKLLPAYIHEMNSVIADRQFVRDVVKGTAKDGAPLAVPTGKVKVVDGTKGQAVLVQPKAGRVPDTSDYRVMPDQPALSNWTWEGRDTDGNPVFVKADLALHPEAYERIQSALGKSAIRQWYNTPASGAAQIPRAVVKGLDVAQGVMKREMFGLLAPFHQVQEGTHAVGHLVNPFFGLEKIDPSKNPAQADAANHGLMLLPDRSSSATYLEGVGAKSSLVSKGIRKAGLESVADAIDGYQDYLFHQYIPALKFKTYEAILGRNMKLYSKELASGEMSPADVKLTSAEQANAAYGHLNYALLDRNPTIKHIVQMAALAPDFLEARARFTGQAIKGISSPVGHEQLKAIAIIAAAQAGSAFVLSNLLGVPYDPQHPFEVVHKGRRYAMRSVPEDIYSLMKDTRQFSYARVNPLTVKGGIQLATGLNYRGEKVGALDTMEELLAGYIPITARSLPGLRSLTETGRNSPITPLQQLSGSLGLRVSRYSPISETYKLAGKWMEGEKLPKDTGSYPVSKYQQLRYALEDGDMDRAAGEYKKLSDTMTHSKISSGFQESINHPFTGSLERDRKFSRTLKGYDKELYDQALITRKHIMHAFHQMPKQ